jgi:hypothetical protein
MVLREALLSYLTLYGEEKCLDFKSFKILFQQAGEGILEWDDVRFLDLTGLLNDAFTIPDLLKCLKRALLQIPEDLDALTLTTPSPKGKSKAIIVADSWDEEAEPTTTATPILPAHLTTPHFTNLTRLSLAHPGPTASWPDLLKLSPNLHKLTHLSLAYWPRPTLTPNAATTTMVSQHARVSLGGTPFYAELDDDYHEAASILRRLSVNTYSLTWLDLEGCAWIHALTWSDAAAGAAGWSSGGAGTAPGPDWTDAWRRIVYVHVFQGWIPTDRKSLQNMPAGVVPVQLMRWLREHDEDEDVGWKLNAGERGHAVQEWVEREKVAKIVREGIAERRKGVGGWCRVDCGWGE